MAPYKYTKRKCAGCGRVIAHSVYGTPKHHHCPHGKVCTYTHGTLGGGDPDHHKAARDERYEACPECADARS
jgi:hypothetical protein